MKEFIISYRKFFLFITVLLLSITFVSKNDKVLEVSAAEATYIVNTSDVEVRTEPKEKGELLTVLDKEIAVTVMKVEGDWSKISLPEASNTSSLGTSSESGYVLSKYLTEEEKYGQEKEEEAEKAEKVVSKGEKVIKYAKKFVGNPYRWGGESLTKGADCSGFVKAVYKHFGKNLPHSSYSLRKVGKKVSSLKKAKAGDIICYSGHVALYMGNNKIVHASSPKTGIKISTNASYRKIVAIRRIFK